MLIVLYQLVQPLFLQILHLYVNEVDLPCFFSGEILFGHGMYRLWKQIHQDMKLILTHSTL